MFNNNKARAGSPSIEDDDDSDDIELDPELARIAQQVQIEAARHSSLHPLGSRSPSPVNAGGGPEVVGIKVRWKPHPLDPNGKKSVWAFEMKRVRIVVWQYIFTNHLPHPDRVIQTYIR